METWSEVSRWLTYGGVLALGLLGCAVVFGVLLWGVWRPARLGEPGELIAPSTTVRYVDGRIVVE